MSNLPLGVGAAPDDNTGDPLRTIFRKLNVSGRVISATVIAQPASPTEDDLYIVPAGATGANWAGQDDTLAWYDGSAWVFYTPVEGYRFWDQANTEMLVYTAGAWSNSAIGGGGSSAYDIRGGFASTPATDEVLDTIPLPRDVTFPADFAGSVGDIGVNPTASFVISVQDDASEIGTITISTGGVFTFVTTGNAQQVVAAGSLLTFVAPTVVDATAADAVFTLLGDV